MALNSTDSSFTDDPFLFNILLAPGTYYIEVAPADFNISDTSNIGDRYALVTSLVLSSQTIPKPTSAVVLLAAGGLSLLRRRRGSSPTF